ncbi:MAG: trigger factor [Cytophagales bacterium]
MEITLEKKDKVNAALRIRLEEVDYKSTYNTKIKEYGKKVQMKGFRAGHVPVGLIEKMYGKNILVEEINTLVSKTVNNYIKENNVEILGDPMPDAKDMAAINWDTQKDFDFTYNLGLAPDFNLDISEKVILEQYKITFKDSVVKETIDNLRKQFGVHTDGEVVELEDIIYANANDENAKLYNAIIPEYRIEEPSRNRFLGAKKGDKIEANVRSAFADDAAIAHVLGIDKKEAPFVSGNFSFEITRISHPTNADLNTEFYTKVFRGTEIATFEEFEAKIRENVATNYAIEAKNTLYSDVFDYFTKNTHIELPETFLKEWLFIVNEGKIAKDEINTQFGGFESTLKWDLIKNKISKEANIHVDNEEVVAKAKNLVQAQFGLADGQVDGEMAKLVNQFADNVLKRDNGKEYRRFYEEAFGEKVLDHIISKVKLKEKAIDVEEYKKIREAKK